MSNIFIIDSDGQNAEAIIDVAVRAGHQASWSPSLTEGMEQISATEVDLLFLEAHLPDGEGLSMLHHIYPLQPRPEVIVMTELGDPDEAEAAIRNGAWDYLQKPLSPEEMAHALGLAIEYRTEKRNRENRAPLHFDRQGIVGDSPALKVCLDSVAAAAAVDVNVLITGETGTGKELFAQAIHRNSQRGDKPLVVVDCAALPKTLVESTLFGYEKGAFTGADRSREGLIKQANGGTLFLDEIGELPLGIQKKFLRVLQERTFRSVGGKEQQKSDFRLIAATNRNLVEMTARGEFREDLLFRLKALDILLPPLRERKEDLKPLALHCVYGLCNRYHLEMKKLSEDFFDVLSSYDWPGNVRELFQVMESTLARGSGNTRLFSQDLPAEVRVKVARGSMAGGDGVPVSGAEMSADIHFPGELPSIKELREKALNDILRKYTGELMRQTAGDIEAARHIAGLSRSRIYAFVKKYGPPRGFHETGPVEIAL